MAHFISNMSREDALDSIKMFAPERLLEVKNSRFDKCEHWGSDFSEPGADYNLYKFYRGDEWLMTVRVAGY